jgi:hypothetical protein
MLFSWQPFPKNEFKGEGREKPKGGFEMLRFAFNFIFVDWLIDAFGPNKVSRMNSTTS